MTTIQFEKKTNLVGEIWFHIRVNGTSVQCFAEHEQDAAAAYYKQVVQGARAGGEISEILAQETIDPKIITFKNKQQ